jgi:hypothetical protein
MEKCSLLCINGNLSILQQLWKSANRVIQPRYFATSASRRQELAGHSTALAPAPAKKHALTIRFRIIVEAVNPLVPGVDASKCIASRIGSRC